MNDYIFFTREKDFKRCYIIKKIIYLVKLALLLPIILQKNNLKSIIKYVGTIANNNVNKSGGFYEFSTRDIVINCESWKNERGIIKALIHEDLHKAIDDCKISEEDESMVEKLTKDSITDR